MAQCLFYKVKCMVFMKVSCVFSVMSSLTAIFWIILIHRRLTIGLIGHFCTSWISFDCKTMYRASEQLSRVLRTVIPGCLFHTLIQSVDSQSHFERHTELYCKPVFPESQVWTYMLNYPCFWPPAHDSRETEMSQHYNEGNTHLDKASASVTWPPLFAPSLAHACRDLLKLVLQKSLELHPSLESSEEETWWKNI